MRAPGSTAWVDDVAFDRIRSVSESERGGRRAVSERERGLFWEFEKIKRELMLS